MKKLILCLFIFPISFHLYSQTEKGNILLGGTGSFGVQDDGSRSFFVFDASPNAGFFVKDDVAIGAAVTIGFTGGRGLSYGIFRIAPFGRYYFGEIGKGKAFLGASAGIQAYVGDVEANLFTASAGPGLAFFLTDDMALEASLPVSYLTDLDGGGNFVDVSVRIGFQFYFPAKKG